MPALAAFFVLRAALLAGQPGIPGPGDIEFETPPQPIYGGELVSPGEWPAVVAVRVDSKLCTGTLVAPDLVLTAAHCFDMVPGNSVTVTLGDDFLATTPIPAADWGAHEGFCYPSECGEDIHDFGWIRLADALVDIDPIPPITDADEYAELMRVDSPLLFVGYGQDELGEVGFKRQVDAAITSINATGREFRAGGEGKDTCIGDSGGPSLVQNAAGQWRLAGVLSRGGDCGEGGVYGVPFPELCWLRDESGVDLLPASCEGCDCVAIEPAAEDGGCGCVAGSMPSPAQRPWWLLAELALLAGLGLLRPRTRSTLHLA